MISRTNLVDSVLHFVSVNSRRVAPRRSRVRFLPSLPFISRHLFPRFSLPRGSLATSISSLSRRRIYLHGDSLATLLLSRAVHAGGASVSTVLLYLISNAAERICGLTDSVSLNTKEKKDSFVVVAIGFSKFGILFVKCVVDVAIGF
ncbi:hypothetical protein Bca101_076815 [Brassica carinata]